MWVSAGGLVFYVVSIYFALLSYREFKGIAYDILLATYNHEASAISLYNTPNKKSKKHSRNNSQGNQNNNSDNNNQEQINFDSFNNNNNNSRNNFSADLTKFK